LNSILIVGAGNMGGVLAKGLCSSTRNYSVDIYDLHFDKSQEIEEMTKAKAFESLSGISKPHDVIILCVKPQDLHVVSEQLKKSTLVREQ